MRDQSVVTTFLPSSFFTTGKRPESRPESLEEKVLVLLQKGPLSKSEIAQSLGHKRISGGLKKALSSLLNQEKIAFTIPEKPNSRFQKYQLKTLT
ncbi:MAG: hypothetical protein K940chlam9_01927 [Chlamydiae bacterium]|nr:hypothetical protein [Chlamydiota bacterium]